MSGKEYFILGSTFLMGAFAGVFLYVTVYAPAYDTDALVPQSIGENAVVIEGRMYGGCIRTDTCSSFRLVNDRTYSYLSSANAEVEAGKLPNDLSERVLSSIGDENFFHSTEEISGETCASHIDKIDFTYEVTFDGETYELDTCGTALAYDEELQNTLLEVWQFMDDPTATYPALIEDGPIEMIIDRF